MKQIYLMAILAFGLAFTGCKKSDSNTGNDNGTSQVPKQNGNLTDYNGYVVKTIGISRALIQLDGNNNLAMASLYGGGNRVIIKPGSGFAVSTQASFGSDPIRVTGGAPDGSMSASGDIIDNGKMPDTSGVYTTFKIKGFDKQKTGYNQLNLVVEKYVFDKVGEAGYFDNITFLNFNSSASNTNIDLQKMFANVNITAVEIAAPKSTNPYIVEDEVFSEGSVIVDNSNVNAAALQLIDLSFSALFATKDNELYNAGGAYKMEWVNADNADITTTNNYNFTAKFPNAKANGRGTIAEPQDSVSRPFLRISGFNPAVCGFNQLRMYVANSFYDGGVMVQYQTPRQSVSLADIKNAYVSAAKLFCVQATQNWHHD